jgi:hypothetical protein
MAMFAYLISKTFMISFGRMDGYDSEWHTIHSSVPTIYQYNAHDGLYFA